MNFGIALQLVKEGKSLTRAAWNGKGQYIMITEFADEYPDYLPFIVIKTVQDKFVPWVASQTDMLAEDWEEVE